ncbi:uncharacterized protein [Henckelia pumila]|uniref:uncharacterized protein n=1 Tax=Henckelia pumila TaxID=405737 RepID=UPI003C6E9BC6
MARRYMNRRRQYLQPLHPPVFGDYGGDYGIYGDYGGYRRRDYGGYDGDYYGTRAYSDGQQSYSYGRQIQAFKRALRLIEDFRAADSDQDGYINRQELEGIRGLSQRKLDMIVDAMQRRSGDRIGTAEFLDLTADKLGGDDEFRKALRMTLRSSNIDSSLRGEDLCEALLGRGVHLSLRETEEMVRAVDSFGVRAIRPQELELVVNALS